MIMLASNPTKN